MASRKLERCTGRGTYNLLQERASVLHALENLETGKEVHSAYPAFVDEVADSDLVNSLDQASLVSAWTPSVGSGIS